MAGRTNNLLTTARQRTFTPRLLGVLLFGGLFTAAAPASAAALRATIDRTQATINDRLQLTLTVEGSQLSSPTLPTLEDFDVHPAGTSRQMQIINGQMSSQVVFTYILQPRKTGTFTIGKATVEIDGQLYESKPFTVTILASQAAPSQTESSEDIFVTATVSNERPFVGEQLVYTMRLYTRVSIAQAEADFPDFNGFLEEPLGEQRTFTTAVQGKEYQVTEVRRALFPQEVGTVTLAAAKITVDVIRRRSGGWFFDPFGSMGGRTQTLVARSKPLELTVRPLPAPPAGFSGLVGQFNLTAQLSKNALKVGESTTLTVNISGSGNVRAIPEPELPGLDAFKRYPDKATSNVDTSGATMRGSKTFRTALVPTQPGELTIPAIRLITFDPKRGSYATTTSRPITVSVAPSDNPEDLKLTEVVGSHGSKVAVKVIADDIRPIMTELSAMPRAVGRVPRWATWTAGFILPPLFFLGLTGWRRRRRAESEDASLKRRRTALRKGLKALGDLSQSESPHHLAREASRTLRSFIGDSLALEGLALTPAEAAERLGAAGVATVLIEEVRGTLERLEAIQYGAPHHGDDLQDIRNHLKGLMTKLDRALPRRSAA